MGIVVKQSAKLIILTYIGFGFGYLNTLIFYPLVLTQDQIGLTRLIISIATLLATFASLGAPTIPMKFFPYFENLKLKHNGFLFFLLILGLIGSLLFSSLLLIFKKTIFTIYAVKSPQLLNYFSFFIPLTFLFVFINIFDSYLSIQKKPIVSTFLKEILIRFFFTIGLISIFYNIINFNFFVSLIPIFYLIILILTLIYTKNIKLLFLSPQTTIFRSKYFKEILVFGGFVLLGNASGTIIANIDGLMISAYSGLALTGVYTIGFFIATLIEIPKRSLTISILPFISQANMAGDINKIEMLYKKSSINQLILGGFIFIIIWLNIDNIFNIIPNGKDYLTGKWVVFYIGIGKLFDLLTGINGEIIGTSKYYKYDLLFLTLLGVIGIITNMIFIPIMGIVGAALASALSLFIFNSIRFLFILSIYKIQPFSVNTFKVLIIMALVFLVNYFIPSFLIPILDIIIRGLVILLVFFGLNLILNTSEDIILLYKKIILKIRKDNS